MNVSLLHTIIPVLASSSSSNIDHQSTMSPQARDKEENELREELSRWTPCSKTSLTVNIRGLMRMKGYKLVIRSSDQVAVRLERCHHGEAPSGVAQPQRNTTSMKTNCSFSINIRSVSKSGLWRLCRNKKSKQLTAVLRHTCEPNPLLPMGISASVSELSTEMLSFIESLHRSGDCPAHVRAHLMCEFHLEYLPDRVIRTATQRFDEAMLEGKCQTARLIETLRKCSASICFATTWLGLAMVMTSASSQASSALCIPAQTISSPAWLPPETIMLNTFISR